MKHLSTALFIAGSICFVLGLIDSVHFRGTIAATSYSSWPQNAITLYLASIASSLLFNRGEKS